jgi:hypothetical protein
MPRYFKQWPEGVPALRKQLKRLKDIAYFSPGQKKALAARMHALGLDPDQANAIPLIGRGPTLLVVFDPASLKVRGIVAAPTRHWQTPSHFKVPRPVQALVPHTPAARQR